MRGKPDSACRKPGGEESRGCASSAHPHSSTARREVPSATAARRHFVGMSAEDRARRMQAKIAEAVRIEVWLDRWA